MQQKTTDFTKGSIPRHLIVFSIPMFLGNLLQALYNVVNSMWVGRFLGSAELAAVSVGFPIIFTLISLVMGVTMATTTLVAQYYGAQKKDMVTKTISNSLLILTFFGLITTLIGLFFNRSMLILINVPSDVLDMAADYLGVFFSGLIGMFWYNVTSAILRGLGDSKTPLKFLIYATVMNILLDPVLIFGLGPIPALGVRGAALATIISQGFSALIVLRYLFITSGLVVITNDFWKLDFSLIRLIIKIGIPAGLQQTLVSLSALTVSALVTIYGSTVVAGYGAAVRIDHFAFMPAMSIGLAVSALVGQNLGAQKDKRVTEAVRWSSLLATAITLAVTLPALLIPSTLLYPFTEDPGVIAAGSQYLRIMAFSYIPLALMFTLGGVLRGAGDTFVSMVFTLVSLWLIRVPLAAFLSQRTGLGVAGIWIGIAVSPVVGVFLNYLYYRSGKWRKSLAGESLSFDRK